MNIIFRFTISDLTDFDFVVSQAVFYIISITEITSALDYGSEFQKTSDVVE